MQQKSSKQLLAAKTYISVQPGGYVTHGKKPVYQSCAHSFLSDQRGSFCAHSATKKTHPTYLARKIKKVAAKDNVFLVEQIIQLVVCFEGIPFRFIPTFPNVNPGLINPWLINRGCPLLVGIHFWREHPPSDGTGLLTLGQVIIA